VTAASNADGWVLQDSASSNYGNDSVVKVDTKSGANARALFRFTLPAIPSGCRPSATLRLYASSYKQGPTLQAVPLGAAWTESGVNWSNQPGDDGSSRYSVLAVDLDVRAVERDRAGRGHVLGRELRLPDP
jgi:large repetitive protein